MIKMGVYALFITFTQHIAIIVWSEHFWFIKLHNGGVSGTPLSNIPTQITIILIVEYIISALLILFGFLKLIKSKGDNSI